MYKVNRLTLKSEAFPEVLRHIPQPPKELYICGDLEEALAGPRLAVVGSRKVTTYGRQVTQDLVGQVAGKGVAIISGLALGVDTIAHQAALEAGAPAIAVLPYSIDAAFKTSRHQLAKDILASGGALVSEYPEGTNPQRQHFIERNRLVSGLSDAVLITEAAHKSGTLHTANFALEQGKTVMAIPGNITSPLSQGTNNLLKSGALLVTEAADILQAMGLDSQAAQQQIFGSTEEETAILELLQSGLTDASLILAESGLDASTFSQTITMLEISGKIRPLGAGHWAIK